MNHPSGRLPNEQYINGLRVADALTLAHIYQEFRQPIIRGIQAAGGSLSDGGVIFRAAVVEAGNQVRNGNFPAQTPFYFQLRELAIAHYRDWQEEKNNVVEKSEGEDLPQENPKMEGILLPDSHAMRQTRRSIYTWRHFEKLDHDCRAKLFEAVSNDALPETEEDEYAEQKPCKTQLLDALKLPANQAAELPQWAIKALQDQDGYVFWTQTQDLERKMAAGKPLIAQPPPKPNPAFRLAAIFILSTFILYAAYNYFFQAATPREVYNDNFVPPASLMEDLSQRVGMDTLSRDSIDERPFFCDNLLRDADEHYKNKDYHAASNILNQITDDAELAPCYADAYFYLGIIALIEESPGEALQCFSKIDNLDRYGEDIYWFQALAFVKIAEQNPSMRERAKDALERTVSSTENLERRAQAQRMLEKLK